MKIVSKYIQAKIFHNASMIYGVFIGLLFIIQAIRMLKYIPASAMKSSHILYFGSLLLPSSLLSTHGIISCSVLYATYLYFINSSEMVAFKSIGYGNKFIISIATRFLILTFFTAFLLGMFVNPSAKSRLDRLILGVKDEYLLSVLKADRLTNFKNTGVYYTEFDGSDMINFTVIRTIKTPDESDKIISIYAEKASIIPDIDGSILVLKNAKTSSVVVGKNGEIDTKTSSAEVSRIRVSQLLQKSDQKQGNTQYNQMNLIQLIQNYQDNKVKMEFHKRLAISYYSFFAGLCVVLCLVSIKSNRGNNKKYHVIAVISASLCIILSFTVTGVLLRKISIAKTVILYLFPIFIVFFVCKILKRIEV